VAGKRKEMERLSPLGTAAASPMMKPVVLSQNDSSVRVGLSTAIAIFQVLAFSRSAALFAYVLGIFDKLHELGEVVVEIPHIFHITQVFVMFQMRHSRFR
jgi:hypothetical protein